MYWFTYVWGGVRRFRKDDAMMHKGTIIGNLLTAEGSAPGLLDSMVSVTTSVRNNLHCNKAGNSAASVTESESS